ncbi:MAG: DUF3617 domain-containing protein [bacterium]
MKKNVRFVSLVLAISILIPILSGFKGGSSSSSNAAVSAASSYNPAAITKVGYRPKMEPGLWKMTIHGTTQMPPMAGHPGMTHSMNMTKTTCLKPGSGQPKPYMPKTPPAYKCSNIKEHTGIDGSIHWAMTCKGPEGITTNGKGVTKITANHFTTHVTMIETMPSGFSMKTIMDNHGKRISSQCSPKY